MMMSSNLSPKHTDADAHPLDVMEQLASAQEWCFDRGGENELDLCLEGKRCDYHLSVNWRHDLAGLHIACAFGLKTPSSMRSEIHTLLARINERLWLGHFDLWNNDGTVLFRHGLLIGPFGISAGQCETIVRLAVDACEQYFPAFQFVLWAGKSADDALAACMFETAGEA